MAGTRVLVTRPEPGASQTARRLEAMGFEPIALPLTDIQPVPVKLADVLTAPVAIVATSANAFRHTPAELLARHAALPCYVVGGSTARAAHAAGFVQVIEGPGDASGLATMLSSVALGGTLLYLCGRVRRPEFERELAKAGVTVAPVETYDTAPARCEAAAEFAAALEGGVDAVLVYSAASAEALLAFLPDEAARHGLEQARFYVLSERIADVLAERFAGRIEVAGEPKEEALLSLLAGETGTKRDGKVKS